MKTHYIRQWLDTEVGKIPRVDADLSLRDKWENFQVRFSLNRMDYKVKPGIYAVGNPGADSNVMVTGNYKLSFDVLRKELKGLDTWILVIDTKGINVWCAAGKGTFGTEELINRVKVTGLANLVSHRRLILPQLGGPGVAAYELKKACGFSAVYGPVRACDIPAYLENKMKATQEMRRVRFTLKDRLTLIPVEVVQGGKVLLFIMAVFFLLSGLSSSGYSLATAKSAGFRAVKNLLLAFSAGAVLSPILLPLLPARQFFIKGIFTGFIMFGVSLLTQLTGSNGLEFAAWFMLIPILSSFITMNLTGASTYTSLSGVKKEMALAVPIQAVFAVLGSGLWIAARFI